MASVEQSQLKAPPEHKTVALWLRHKADLKLRTGVLGGNRVDYFKGRPAVKALLSPAYAKLSNVPPVTDEASAEKLLNEMIPSMFYLRVERGDHLPAPPGPNGTSSSSTGKQPRVLRIAQAQRYSQDEYFVWFVPASQLKTTLGGVALVLAIVGGCMFPLWPLKLRIGVWYLAMGTLGLIGLLIVIAIVRLIVWLITKFTVKPGIWIFPRLFDDLGVIESFQPLWAWDLPPPPKKHKKRTKKDEGEATTSEKKATPVTAAGQTQRNGVLKGSAKIEEIQED